MALGDMVFNSDGKAVHVDLLYSVRKNQLAVVDGWLGVTASDGESGDTIALTVDGREYQLEVPQALGAKRGDIIYIDITDLTNHDVDSSAYSLNTPGNNLVALMKVTHDQDANNVVIGIMLKDQPIVVS